jgi:hypothetical protein
MRLLLFGPKIFGLRTGLSLGREDFARFAGQQTSASAIDPDHSFLYVVKGDHGLCIRFDYRIAQSHRTKRLKIKIPTGALRR